MAGAQRPGLATPAATNLTNVTPNRQEAGGRGPR